MAKLTNQDWIDRFRDSHGDKYTYGEFTTLGKNRSVEIFCKDHGVFIKQVTNHWKGTKSTGVAGGECPRCHEGQWHYQSNRFTSDEWIVKFRASQQIEYDYSSVKLHGEKVTTFFCTDHGEFRQKKTDHALGRVGCLGCRTRLAREKFLQDASDRFGEIYSYESFIYKNAKTKSVIVCPDHGDFLQNPDKHLTSIYPCPTCNQDARSARHSGVGGWYSRSAFNESKELANKPAHVYYVKIGVHYKIGMTTDLKSRLSRLRGASGHDVAVLDLYECTAHEAYLLEQNILIRYDEHRVWSRWTTEIFEIDVLDGQKLSEYELDETIYHQIR